MKKVLFCLSLIISLSVLGVVPSFAMEFTIDPATIGSIGDLGYGLAGGMEIDFNDSFIAQKYRGEYESAGTSQGKRLVAQKAANDFITNYAISRGLPLPSDASDYVENLPTDVYGYFKSVYFDNQARSIVNKVKLAPDNAAALDALRFGIGPAAFADWSSYSTFWYNKYQAIGETTDSDDPFVIPDEYSYLNNLNHIYIRSYLLDSSYDKILRYGDTYTFSAGDYSKQSFISTNINAMHIPNEINVFETLFATNGIASIYVVTNESGATVSYWNCTAYQNAIIPYNFCGFAPTSVNESTGTINTNTFYNANQISSYTRSSFDSLAAALAYIYQHYTNINLYVNGELWCDAGAIDDAPANPIIPTFPDVIDPTSDDPAYTIDLPATDTGEGYFDITSLFDALVDAIEGAIDDDPTTDGILDGTKGLEYEDEEGDAVGDDPIPDDDVIDDSIPDPTGLPNIPVPLPPIQDAFSGTTVLAELVHATDVVMPDDLMAVFWGIVFILFIIGLIKVLHK